MPSKRPEPAKQIDWQHIHARLARSAQALENVLHLTPEQGRAVMEHRARALATVAVQEAASAEILDVVVFTLAGERYGISAEHVREVIRFTEFTPIPGAPDFLVGVLNLRGVILAVIDLRKFFGVAQRGLTDLSRVVVLGDERAEFGVLADTVAEVKTLRSAEVLEAPASVAGIAREYLRGVTADALIVLDSAVLLRDQRLFIDQSKDTGI